MRLPRRALLGLALAGLGASHAQVIEFESGGLRYKTLTRNGITIMYAHLPANISEYSIMQVAVSNGSQTPCTIGPEDFVFQRPDGGVVQPTPARTVVNRMIDRASRSDVIKLVATYELGLYGLSRFQSTNGYEQRRQSALAEVTSAKIKAAAAASAIAMVRTRLTPGQSTDGAVFYPTAGKPLGPGRLTIRAAGEVFDFEDPDPRRGTP